MPGCSGRWARRDCVLWRVKQVSNVYQRFKESVSWKDLVLIILGSALGPFALQTLLMPSEMLTGGVGGLAVLLQFVTGMPSWIFYTVINIPVFLAGFRFVSPRFFFYSLLGTGSFAAYLALFERFNGLWQGTNLLMNAVLGGLIYGIGCGVVLKGKGSGGGMDIVAVILRRKWGFQLGEVMLAANLLIITASAFITSPERAFYSAVTMFVSSKMIDRVMMGFGGNKTVMVITQKPEPIIQAVLMDLHHGCTCLKGEGAYTREDRQVLLITIYRSQLPMLREVVYRADPKAFVIVYESDDVYGKGFSPAKNDDF